MESAAAQRRDRHRENRRDQKGSAASRTITEGKKNSGENDTEAPAAGANVLARIEHIHGRRVAKKACCGRREVGRTARMVHRYRSYNCNRSRKIAGHNLSSL